MARPWMPLYVADYLGDTRHLSTLKHGAYLLLIMHYWQTGGLPTDDAKLARIAGVTSEQWCEVRSTLAELFDENWRHGRVERELGEAARRSENARRAGKMSAQARAAATPGEPPLRAGCNGAATQSQPRARVSQPQYSEACASAAAAAAAHAATGDAATAAPATAAAIARAPPAPAYTDVRHALWGDGVLVLAQLGIAEKSARANIGRWLRDTGDDAGAVLGAIERARAPRDRSGSLDHPRAQDQGERACRSSQRPCRH